MCPCGKAIESRTHIVEECEMHTEGRDALEEELREIDECDMEEFGTLESSEKTIAMLGDRWWPQAAKQEGVKGTLAPKRLLEDDTCPLAVTTRLLASNIDCVLTGHSQSSLGVHISYELVHTPIAIPNSAPCPPGFQSL